MPCALREVSVPVAREAPADLEVLVPAAREVPADPEGLVPAAGGRVDPVAQVALEGQAGMEAPVIPARGTHPVIPGIPRVLHTRIPTHGGAVTIRFIPAQDRPMALTTGQTIRNEERERHINSPLPLAPLNGGERGKGLLFQSDG